MGLTSLICTLVALSGGNATDSAHGRTGVSTVRGITIQTLGNGQYLGRVSSINATEVLDSSSASGAGQVRILGDIGPDMQIALDEAVRAVRSMRPKWNSKVDVSFSEKYAPKDGPSAATAFACLMLSLADGVPLSQDAVLTGDIDVAGNVLIVGGVPDKIRGAIADNARLFLLPISNDHAASDLALLDSWKALWQIQIFAVDTLPHAMSLVRRDRDVQTTEAVDLFANLASDRLSKPSAARPKLDDSEQEALQRVVTLCPMHLSAALLLLRNFGKAPSSLTVETALHEILVAARPVLPLLGSQEVPSDLGDTFTPDFVRETRQALAKISKVSHDKTKELADSFAAFLVEIEKVGTDLKDLRRKRRLTPTIRFENDEHPFYRTQRRVEETLVSLGQDVDVLRKFDSGK